MNKTAIYLFDVKCDFFKIDFCTVNTFKFHGNTINVSLQNQIPNFQIFNFICFSFCDGGFDVQPEKMLNRSRKALL